MAGQIECIRVFVKVADLSSFAEAARTLGVTRSIVTRYVGELEETLGVQLFVRTTRKVSMTVAGQVYLDRTRPIIDELDRANEVVQNQHEGLSGDLRISAPVSLGTSFLPIALTNFRNTYPEISIKLDLSDGFVDLIEDNQDMALRISGPPSGVSNIWRKIKGVPRVMVASPSYFETRNAPDSPADLQGHCIMGYSNFAGGNIWALVNQTSGEKINQKVDSAIEANNSDILIEMALRGNGITMTPRFLVADYLQKGAMIQVLSDWTAPDIWLTAYYPPYERLPAKVEAFTRFVEEMVAADPNWLE